MKNYTLQANFQKMEKLVSKPYVNFKDIPFFQSTKLPETRIERKCTYTAGAPNCPW